MKIMQNHTMYGNENVKVKKKTTRKRRKEEL